MHEEALERALGLFESELVEDGELLVEAPLRLGERVAREEERVLIRLLGRHVLQRAGILRR